jgi:hypothetical protein
MMLFWRGAFSYFITMISKQIVIPLFCSLVALAFTGCSTTHVHKLHMEVSESPEVHGPNTFQKPHSSMLRVTGKFNIVNSNR